MRMKIKYILNSLIFFNANDYFCRNICSLLARFERFTRNHRQKCRFAFTSSSISRAFYPSSFAVSWTRILRSVRKSNKSECQDLFRESDSNRAWRSIV